MTFCTVYKGRQRDTDNLIAGHRFNDERGLRRRKHSTLSSVVWIGQAGNKQKGKAKAIDHSPHEVSLSSILIKPKWLHALDRS